MDADGGLCFLLAGWNGAKFGGAADTAGCDGNLDVKSR